MEAHTVRNKKVLKAGWKPGRTSLTNMRRLETMLLAPQIIAMLDSVLPDLNPSIGASISQQQRSTSHFCCCCCCSCCCC